MLSSSQQLFDHVKNNTSEFWAQSFVKQLQVIREQPFQFSRTPLLDYQQLKTNYQKAKKRIMFFDYDVSSLRLANIWSRKVIKSCVIYREHWLLLFPCLRQLCHQRRCANIFKPFATTLWMTSGSSQVETKRRSIIGLEAFETLASALSTAASCVSQIQITGSTC